MEAADWGFAPADIKVPVLLWHREADEDAPVKVGHYLAQQIPGALSSFVKSESHSMIRRKWVAVCKSSWLLRSRKMNCLTLTSECRPNAHSVTMAAPSKQLNFKMTQEIVFASPIITHVQYHHNP